MAINPAVVHRLQVVRDIVKFPILICSGFRCLKHNTEVSGAKNSEHLHGNAIDWRIEDYAMSYVAQTLDNWSGGFHFYQPENFIHIDVGLRRRWS